ncbi:MAG: hypothetical protein MPJ50_08600 [Pirellulales bacterium]|nr:hypothetical protein [Pirellulales bacterium]
MAFEVTEFDFLSGICLERKRRRLLASFNPISHNSNESYKTNGCVPATKRHDCGASIAARTAKEKSLVFSSRFRIWVPHDENLVVCKIAFRLTNFATTLMHQREEFGMASERTLA